MGGGVRMADGGPIWYDSEYESNTEKFKGRSLPFWRRVGVDSNTHMSPLTPAYRFGIRMAIFQSTCAYRLGHLATVLSRCANRLGHLAIVISRCANRLGHLAILQVRSANRLGRLAFLLSTDKHRQAFR